MATSVEPNSSPIMENNTALFSFIVQGIGITVVGSLGILGNIIGLFILTRPKMKSSITWFLLGLSTFDLLFLILCILIYGLVSASEYLETGESYRALMDPENSPWLVTINDTAQTASVYFTIAIAVERYFVIRWPINSRPYCTYKRCGIYSIFVLAFACTYQLQRLVFVQAKIEIDRSILTEECPHLLPSNETGTELQADDDYEQYFFRWPYMTFMMVGPTLILIALNSLIWLELRERNDKIKQMTSRSREDKERSITVMLFAVVMTFLLCQTVFYVMAFLEAYKKCAWESTKFYLIPMDLFLITTNSSVNFLIYAVFGSRFREELKIVLRQWTGICLFGGNSPEMSECTERSTKEEKSSTAL